MGNTENKIHKNKSGDSVLIRNAAESDAAQIIEINKEVIGEIYYMLREPEEGNYTLENAGNDIKNHLNNPGSLYIVAEVAGKVSGFLEFQNGGLRRTAHTGILSMFIHKADREKGVGSLLLKTLIDWAGKNPLIEKITLAVFSTNERAQMLYKKFGFAEEGRCPKDMKLKDGSYIDSVLMYKFVELIPYLK
ncbi:MAG: GNAT family N-acetyltransferase [Ignavibacteria bacterium]